MNGLKDFVRKFTGKPDWEEIPFKDERPGIDIVNNAEHIADEVIKNPELNIDAVVDDYIAQGRIDPKDKKVFRSHINWQIRNKTEKAAENEATERPTPSLSIVPRNKDEN
jgi:pimeloyl-CoA synthetase